MNASVRTLLLTCGALILAIAGYLYLKPHTASAPSSEATASTTTQNLSNGVTVTVPVGATVEEVTGPAAPLQPVAPNYRREIVYASSVTSEVRTAVEAHRTEDIMLISKNATDFNAWMDLATVTKIAGDYQGAEAIWLYATKVWPTSPIAFSNLADLYANFLKNPAKAKLYADQAAKLQTP